MVTKQNKPKIKQTKEQHTENRNKTTKKTPIYYFIKVTEEDSWKTVSSVHTSKFYHSIIKLSHLLS